MSVVYILDSWMKATIPNFEEIFLDKTTINLSPRHTLLTELTAAAEKRKSLLRFVSR